MENNDLVPLDMPELLATEWGWDYELPPAWTWQWVCYSVIDMWTQEWEYQWSTIISKKIRIGFEFADDEDKIHTIHKEFTLSFGWKSKLKQFIDAWNWWMTPMTNEQAKWFNVYSLLSRECSLNVVHKKSKTKNTDYADIGWLSPRIKKIALHERKNANMWLHLSKQYFNEDVFELLPQFLKDNIQKSPEYLAIYDLTPLAIQEAELHREAQANKATTASVEDAEDIFKENQ